MSSLNWFKRKPPWCMLFTNDIIVVDETRSEVNAKLEIWQDTLEYKGWQFLIAWINNSPR